MELEKGIEVITLTEKDDEDDEIIKVAQLSVEDALKELNTEQAGLTIDEVHTLQQTYGKNVFAKAFIWIKKVSIFIIKKFFWLVAVLSTYTGFSYLFSVRMMENVEKMTKCFESAKDLLEFLKEHQELAIGIYEQLFTAISGNNGDHKLTLEEKEKIKKFANEMLKTFHPDRISKLKNLTKEDLEKITIKTNDMLDALGV